jgi:hypothetical protein
MTRLAGAVCLGVLLVSLLGPTSAGAQEAIGVEEIRSIFVDAGYEVDQAVTWPWQMPIVTSFHVTDRRGARGLLVEVFGAADEARVEAERKAGATRVHNVVLFQSGTRAMVNESEMECAPDQVNQDLADAPNAVDADLVNDVARLLT